MAKLAECNTEDCHRGIERSTTDPYTDGYSHPQVRVACSRCGVVGPWHVDDSLTRAIDDWNSNHVSRGAEVVAQQKAEAADAARTAKARHLAMLEQALVSIGPEIAVNELKVSSLKEAKQGTAAAHFETVITNLKAEQKRVKTEIEALKAQG